MLPTVTANNRRVVIAVSLVLDVDSTEGKLPRRDEHQSDKARSGDH